LTIGEVNGHFYLKIKVKQKKVNKKTKKSTPVATTRDLAWFFLSVLMYLLFLSFCYLKVRSHQKRLIWVTGFFDSVLVTCGHQHPPYLEPNPSSLIMVIARGIDLLKKLTLTTYLWGPYSTSTLKVKIWRQNSIIKNAFFYRNKFWYLRSFF